MYSFDCYFELKSEGKYCRYKVRPHAKQIDEFLNVGE